MLAAFSFRRRPLLAFLDKSFTACLFLYRKTLLSPRDIFPFSRLNSGKFFRKLFQSGKKLAPLSIRLCLQAQKLFQSGQELTTLRITIFLSIEKNL
ncbi:MAG: hypothetical protein NC311_17150 [Muribaculaceae bacterium]|nr:hypothetical protein [Muribaculaceae bacterium]